MAKRNIVFKVYEEDHVTLVFKGAIIPNILSVFVGRCCFSSPATPLITVFDELLFVES